MGASFPLLPVNQTTATIFWPQGSTADGNITQITAPLVSGAPRALDISIPCSAIATLPANGGLVLSTLPAGGVDTGKAGLFVRANPGHGRRGVPRLGGRGGGPLHDRSGRL
ncbi:indolylacetylinositol arabinosyltransferase [Mycobacterium tuberculosis RGTB327]|nr:indolylacetylinositol arabinosyltransferase [Mycobacterium tuberculosis RGTB327]